MRYDEAYELWVGRPGAEVVLTCEHASEHFPEPWGWLEEDAWLSGTHWSHDPGAAELTRILAQELGAPAVLSRFSRLLADPNRPEEDATLFRLHADGRPVALNQDLSSEERAQRLEQLYRPYHFAVDRMVGESRAPIVFAVHSFTPHYEGEAREMELGILFDEHEAPAHLLAERLADELGTEVALNEPYSGKVLTRLDLEGDPAVAFSVTSRGVDEPFLTRVRLGEALARVLLDVARGSPSPRPRRPAPSR